VSFDIGNGNQDDNVSLDIGNGNQSLDVSFDMDNRSQDCIASIVIGNSTQGRDASFNIRDGVQNGMDAIDGVDAKVMALAQAFQSIGTDGIFESVCIYTAL
jgi:hypothetical protein